MRKCQTCTCKSPSADGQKNGEDALLRELAGQVNEALASIMKRIEALERTRGAQGGPSVIITVGGESRISVEPNDEKIGFNVK
jgi:prefoldin subunit 5